ncbi:glutamine--fructose-6-phosphate transaminase (isomerizing) [Campylobacter troglodytis]|uniref:glutamine--fructose-6-phosphate transaminase (isomerizing) n=1 Tax=Campylobacter troglodytis TaxID=654363 RepID=UPI001157EB23|nr:glutamine--fructose-6-phosphate transaminase (isomerizing) [Campylobacter troglodytis]TQR55821.1 glutamine--fructose-6-phosphate transaminase (isomerizing) [Campylobacter troglodytis]
MCGIVGYIGKNEKKSLILAGLKELEYRGYDSAGLAVLRENELDFFKAVGKLENLANKCKGFQSSGEGVAIGHTRWATHGKPTEINAHPHLGEYSCVIHNGIIENYKELKDSLESKGINFVSQTDTEVIVQLFELYARENEPFVAFKKVVSELKGAFATLLITKKAPDSIFFAKNSAPLIIGKSEDNELFFASSDTALMGQCEEVIYLEDLSYGFASKNELKIYQNNTLQSPKFSKLTGDKSLAQKDGFRFFMEKEIYEQSRVLSEVLMGRISGNEVIFDELEKEDLSAFDELSLCACGTSYHAALAASYLFERLARIKCKVEVASEFRYREAVVHKNSLFIVISQSGETADTLEALKIAKEKGAKTFAVCNVDNSSITRLAHLSLLTRAGIEKGVASTKAFATQILTLWMLAIYIAQKKGLDMSEEVAALLHTPNVCKVNASLHEKIRRLSKRYLDGHGFFYIGRDVFYPLALEGALKLKELSYLHAEGYAAGEMKHGPIALADSKLYTIALLPEHKLYEKAKSNVEELVARDSTLLVISPLEFELADDFIKTSIQGHYMCEFFEMMVIIQLIALEISIRLGNDVDMPRNLAKSVTVE